MRSEFTEAATTLNTVISHLRSYNLFPAYAPTICLLQAFSAHAQGRTRRAIECYRAARSNELGTKRGSFIWGSGWIGEIAIRVGLGVIKNASTSGAVGPSTSKSAPLLPIAEENDWIAEGGEYEQTAEEVVKLALGGTWGVGMQCVGRVLEASVSGEIVRAKYVSWLILSFPFSFLTRSTSLSSPGRT